MRVAMLIVGVVVLVVAVAAFDMAPDRSTSAVFSRSRLGHGDLGVNEQRVERRLGER